MNVFPDIRRFATDDVFDTWPGRVGLFVWFIVKLAFAGALIWDSLYIAAVLGITWAALQLALQIAILVRMRWISQRYMRWKPQVRPSAFGATRGRG